MSDKHSHITKAKHNEGLLQPLVGLTDYSDWYITVSFYAAVHWIRAFLALNSIGISPRNEIIYDDFPRHIRDVCRKKGINTQEGEDFIAEFEDLKGISQDARYKTYSDGTYARQTHEADASLREIKAFVVKYGIVP